MKWIRKCPLFLLLLISGLLFALAAFAGADRAYAGYEAEGQPVVGIVFQGLKDGIYPWNCMQDGGTQAVDYIENAEGGADGEDAADGVAEAENTDGAAETADGAEGTVSGNDVPENIVSEEEKTYSFEPVDETYFADALFIGDSRTQGLFEYGGIDEWATFYSKTSLTIYDIFHKPKQFIELENESEKLTVEEALSGQQFKKIYLMLGINELGRGTIDSFMEEYERVVARIRELQPDAILFIQGIMRVAGGKSASDPIFNNENINARNERLAQLADNKNIFYIDVNESVCDENGDLVADWTYDQIHLKAKYYEIWVDYLLEHGIVKETFSDTSVETSGDTAGEL